MYIYCRKGDPFQSPRVGSCLTLGNELSEETHVLTKQETLLGRGTRAESSRIREPRRTALPHSSQSQVLQQWGQLPVVPGQSSCLAHIWSDSGSFWWLAHLSAKMDPSVWVSGRLAAHIISSLLLLALPEFFWVSFTRRTMGWCVLPPLGPSRILLVSFQVAAPSSLSEPPVVRQFTQVVIIGPGQGGRFWSAVP